LEKSSRGEGKDGGLDVNGKDKVFWLRYSWEKVEGWVLSAYLGSRKGYGSSRIGPTAIQKIAEEGQDSNK